VLSQESALLLLGGSGADSAAAAAAGEGCIAPAAGRLLGASIPAAAAAAAEVGRHSFGPPSVDAAVQMMLLTPCPSYLGVEICTCAGSRSQALQQTQAGTGTG